MNETPSIDQGLVGLVQPINITVCRLYPHYPLKKGSCHFLCLLTCTRPDSKFVAFPQFYFFYQSILVYVNQKYLQHLLQIFTPFIFPGWWKALDILQPKKTGCKIIRQGSTWSTQFTINFRPRLSAELQMSLKSRNCLVLPKSKHIEKEAFYFIDPQVL